MEASPFSIENILKPPTTDTSGEDGEPSTSRTTEALTLAEKLAGKIKQLAHAEYQAADLSKPFFVELNWGISQK